MSDEGLTVDAVPDAVTQAETAAPSASPSVADGATDPLGDLPADRAVFDRGYVEKVRGEAQRYREQARTAAEQFQPYQEVFGIYDDADRDVWFDLARTWATNPERAAQVMQQIADSVLKENGDAVDEPEPTTTIGDPATTGQLTPEQVQTLIDEKLSAREQQAAERQAINDVFTEVRAAGFDPDTAEGFMVLYNANHYTSGDITKAIDMTKQYQQKIIDDYVAGRAAGTRAAPSPSGGVVATSTGSPITSIEDARKATDAFLRERRSAQ